MKYTDHLHLAKEYVMQTGESMDDWKKVFFLYGNMEPDFNIITYLRGHKKYQKFRGHNYDNVIDDLCEMIRRDMGKKLTVRRAYRLGRCMHFLADIFTYPHNKEYTGTLKEHIAYEKKLHIMWSDVLCGRSKVLYFQEDDVEEFLSWVKDLHQTYISEEHSKEHDISYITKVTERFFCSCWNTEQVEEVSYESLNHVGMVQTSH